MKKNLTLIRSRSTVLYFICLSIFLLSYGCGSSLPLSRAIENSNLREANNLIKENKGINDYDQRGLTPLHYAAYYDHVEIVESLIKAGANVNAEAKQATNNNTPLYEATLKGNTSVAKILIENGANVDAESTNGSTPLIAASQYNHLDIVRLLLEYGADINASTTGGYTPIYLASEYGHSEVVKMLLKHGADANSIANRGDSPLYVASQNGHSEVVKILLAHGADVNIKFKNQFSPLDIASEAGHTEIVNLLSANRAQINAKSTLGEKLSHMTNQKDHVDQPKTKIAHSVKGGSVLHDAAQAGDDNTVKRAIAQGADVNVKKAHGETALHLAALNGQQAVAEVLIANGAQVNIKSDFGLTPLSYAAQEGHVGVAEVLIANGAQVNIKSDIGETPLSYAAQEGHVGVTEVLIANGADVSAKWPDGQTPLILAARGGHSGVVEMLIANGAEIFFKANAFENVGASAQAFQLAAEYYKGRKEHAQFIVFITDAFKTETMQDHEKVGQTFLMIAEHYENSGEQASSAELYEAAAYHFDMVAVQHRKEADKYIQWSEDATKRYDSLLTKRASKGILMFSDTLSDLILPKLGLMHESETLGYWDAERRKLAKLADEHSRLASYWRQRAAAARQKCSR